MNATTLDSRGVINDCPKCGQRNRIPFAELAHQARCGRCKAQLPAQSAPLNIEEEAEFDALIEQAAMPVLVDFWADWCGPCKMMAPELNRAAAHGAGHWLAAKANTEGLPGLSQRFAIQALPTLALFVSGREVARIQGARSAAEIQKFVQQAARQK